MYIVYEAFDDNTAIILDINTFAKYECSESDLIKLANKEGNNVLGLSVSNNKLNYITAYECISFPTEADADEYIKDNNLTYKNKRLTSNYYWVFTKKNYKIHVNYYVCTYRGDEISYVANVGKYTPYIQAAKSFDKHTAKKKAAFMSKNGLPGTHWTTQRVIIR